MQRKVIVEQIKRFGKNYGVRNMEGWLLLREVMKLETEFNIITNDTLTTKKPTISARLRAVHDAAMRQKEEVESKEEAKEAEELENGINIQPIVNKTNMETRLYNVQLQTKKQILHYSHVGIIAVPVEIFILL